MHHISSLPWAPLRRCSASLAPGRLRLRHHPRGLAPSPSIAVDLGQMYSFAPRKKRLRMVDTDGLYVPMLASVLTRGTPLLSFRRTWHSGGEPPRDSQNTDRLSRSSVGSFMFFASEWLQDCVSVMPAHKVLRSLSPIVGIIFRQKLM